MTELYDDIQYCKWHPQVETALACYQCNTPICVKCAQRTPVGYLCPDCVRGRKKRYEQIQPTDYVIAVIAAAGLALLASIIPLIGWYVLLLSPLAGTGIAEAVWRLVQRHYGERLWWAVGGGIVLGSLPLMGLTLLNLTGAIALGYTGEATISLIWVILHLPLMIGAAAARLRLT